MDLKVSANVDECVISYNAEEQRATVGSVKIENHLSMLATN